MLAVNTDVLVRLLARDDAKDALAADLAVANGAWISHPVLIEPMGVLAAVYERSPSS